MNKSIIFILLLASFLCSGRVQADVLPPIPLNVENARAQFKINSSFVSRTDDLVRLIEIIDSLSNAGSLQSVVVVGSSSPDGPTKLNDRLAKRRADAVGKFIAENSVLNPDQIQISSIGEDIDGFRELVNESSNPNKTKVQEIINNPNFSDKDELALKLINNRKAWKWLAADIFPRLRTAVITVTSEDIQIVHNTANGTTETYPELKAPVIEEPEVVAPYIEEVTAVYEEAEIIPEAEDEWVRHLYLKTNMPAWFMLWTNVAVEVDLAPHWSATLPVYYSGFNYFKHTLKFRTLTLQPEARYWFRGDNSGPFIGAHFSVAWWNTAFDGQYRYQDHYRHTPAIGGGLAVGWRFNFCRNPRWQMEATIGGGVYKLDYDLFQNKYNGLLVGRRKRTFYGIDQAALTISYRFDIEHKKSVKKGGDQ